MQKVQAVPTRENSQNNFVLHIEIWARTTIKHRRKEPTIAVAFLKTGELTDLYKHFYKLVISHCHLA